MTKYLHKIDNIKKLKQHIKIAIEEAELQDVDEMTVETFVSGHAGNNIPKEFYEIIDYKAESPTPENDGYWDEFTDILNHVNEDISELFRKEGLLDEYPDWDFALDFWESDGALDLIVYRKDAERSDF